MTVKEFLEQHNNSPYDDIELADIAGFVEGKVGKMARQFTLASMAFNEALTKIGYERG